MTLLLTNVFILKPETELNMFKKEQNRPDFIKQFWKQPGITGDLCFKWISMLGYIITKNLSEAL